jgi:hypothetical protein
VSLPHHPLRQKICSSAAQCTELWVCGAGNGLGGDDEEELDEQDAFEAKYNFRFEEPGSERIVPHPRMQEHSIRKEETKRKRERSNKKERCVDEREREKRQKRRRDVLLNVNPYSLFPPQGGGGEAAEARGADAAQSAQTRRAG